MLNWRGGDLASDHLAIPLSRRKTSFSGELWIAGVLDGAGKSINSINSAERDALRKKWGPSLDELISLSQERDPRVFFHGLLQIGRRLEDNDQIDLAGVVYSNLRGGEEKREGGEKVPPLKLRGGQEGLLPLDVANQAQRRLDAINGVGDWRERFAFSLQRIPNQSTRWDLILAMTGAGLSFRGFRLLTTARWAGSFESALTLNAASASTAFLAETIAFTSLGKIAGALAGHPQDTSGAGVFNEWAGGAAMLLGLKGMGAITGAGVRSIYGEAGAVGARHAVPLRRFTEIFAPQAGMFMGILVGHRLAEVGGFHPERRGDNWLVDGVTTLIEFNVAGRIQRVAVGPTLANLETRFESLTRSMGQGFERPPSHELLSWAPENGFALASTSGNIPGEILPPNAMAMASGGFWANIKKYFGGKPLPQLPEKIGEGAPRHKGAYVNLDGTTPDKKLKDVLRWLASSKPVDASSFVTPVRENDGSALQDTAPSLTWIGHASWAQRLAGKLIFTDPIWSKRIGFYKRQSPPGVALEAMPKPDIVTVSHSHHDHLDMPTLKRIGTEALYIVPKQVGNILTSAGLKRVVELDWWETYRDGDLEITLVPSHHWSMRMPWDRNKRLWGGFIYRSPESTTYHAGDTAFNEKVFSLIAERFPNIDYAMLPIGAYDPQWFMKAQHMGPEEAVHAWEILGARNFVAMHWGAFKLTDEPLGEPPQRLRKRWEERGHAESRLWIMDVGETRKLDLSSTPGAGE